jgi:hypothetical protein
MIAFAESGNSSDFGYDLGSHSAPLGNSADRLIPPPPMIRLTPALLLATVLSMQVKDAVVAMRGCDE